MRVGRFGRDGVSGLNGKGGQVLVVVGRHDSSAALDFRLLHADGTMNAVELVV